MRNLIKISRLLFVGIAFTFSACTSKNEKTEELLKTDTKYSGKSDDSDQEDKKDFSESKKEPLKSEITCPKCGYKKKEILPTEVCLISYTCENCKIVLHPQNGDCCIFCTYGDQKCPSKQ